MSYPFHTLRVCVGGGAPGPSSTRAIVNDGFEHMSQASRLERRVTAERNHLEGVPSPADIHRAALLQQQRRGMSTAPGHEPPTLRPQGANMSL